MQSGFVCKGDGVAFGWNGMAGCAHLEPVSTARCDRPFGVAYGDRATQDAPRPDGARSAGHLSVLS